MTQKGVDLEAGNSFSAFAHSVISSSFDNSPYVAIREGKIGGFRSSRGFRLKGLPKDLWETMVSDGIGTKVIITDAAQLYLTSAYDLLAMTCGDITRKGGLPLLINNTLNVASLGEPGSNINDAARTLLIGLMKVAKEQKVVLFNGETAELKGLSLANSDPKFSYLWESTAHGVFREETEITGTSIRPGQTIIALQDKSPGSNGITELRAGLEKLYAKPGLSWWQNPDAARDIELASMPCTLYDNFLTHLNGWYQPDFQPLIKIHGIAHISGGGIPDKLAGDLLFEQGYGAELNDLFVPPVIFDKVGYIRRSDFGSLSDIDYIKRLYNNWHSGQRLLLILDEGDVNTCINYATQSGLQAQVAGFVTENQILKIRNKYSVLPVDHVYYSPEDLIRS